MTSAIDNAIANCATADPLLALGGHANSAAPHSGSFAALCASQLSVAPNESGPAATTDVISVAKKLTSKGSPSATPNADNSGHHSSSDSPNAAVLSPFLLLPMPLPGNDPLPVTNDSPARSSPPQTAEASAIIDAARVSGNVAVTDVSTEALAFSSLLPAMPRQTVPSLGVTAVGHPVPLPSRVTTNAATTQPTILAPTVQDPVSPEVVPAPLPACNAGLALLGSDTQTAPTSPARPKDSQTLVQSPRLEVAKAESEPTSTIATNLSVECSSVQDQAGTASANEAIPTPAMTSSLSSQGASSGANVFRADVAQCEGSPSSSISPALGQPNEIQQAAPRPATDAMTATLISDTDKQGLLAYKFLRTLRSVVTDALAFSSPERRQNLPPAASSSQGSQLSNPPVGISAAPILTPAQRGSLTRETNTTWAEANHASAGTDAPVVAGAPGQSVVMNGIVNQLASMVQEAGSKDTQSVSSQSDSSDPSRQKKTSAVVAQTADLPPAAPPSTSVVLLDPTTKAANSELSTSIRSSKADRADALGTQPLRTDLPGPRESPMAPGAGSVQMAQMVNKAAQSEMRIGLNTSAFGSVEVRTVVHANEVGVLIGSEKGDLRSLLANELPGIANTLQQHDLRLNPVHFHQGFAFSNQTSSEGDSQPRSFHSKANFAGPQPAGIDRETNEPPEPSSNRYRSGLSILA